MCVWAIQKKKKEGGRRRASKGRIREEEKKKKKDYSGFKDFICIVMYVICAFNVVSEWVGDCYHYRYVCVGERGMVVWHQKRNHYFPPPPTIFNVFRSLSFLCSQVVPSGRESQASQEKKKIEQRINSCWLFSQATSSCPSSSTISQFPGAV